MTNHTKLIRTSTIPGSLNTFCRGLLKELSDEGYEVVAVSSPGPHLNEIRDREGVKVIEASMERHISPLRDLKSLWRLVKIFRAEKPDMIHSITPKAGLLSMIAGCICRVPVRLHTFTGLVFPTSTGLTRKILMLTDRITCACATHIVPEGEGVKNDLIKHRITRKPLCVLGFGNIRGIDMEHYDPRLPEVKEQSAAIRRADLFTFICIGRLVRDKGINELIEAFTQLHKRHPQCRLILVGRFEHELDPLLPETLMAIESNPAIEAVGPQSDVRPWLAASDCLVCPSYREGFPNVVIEAGAMDLPSIVTDINGSREIILNEENGIIVPPLDADALEYAMEIMLKDKELRHKLASNARQLIASRYEQSFVRSCLKAYYKEILNR